MKNVHFAFPLLFMILSSCGSSAGKCAIKTVLLEESFFPRKVSSDPIASPISDDAPPDSASQLFYIHGGSSIDGVQQDIMNFGLVFRASSFYKNGEEQTFDGQWEITDESATIDLSADQFHLACGIEFGNRTCRWLARYQAYYLYLRSDISEKGMTEQIFLDAVKEIDSRMVQCLGE